MISVIIPNYNHSPFLRKRIESVLEQTYRELEVIVLDDCSTDNSREIIESYRGHPLVKTILYNSQNSGSSFIQWNRGVALAKGDFVWIAESDDYADKNMLSCCVDALDAVPSADLVYCDSFEVDENDIVLGRWSRWQKKLSHNLWTSDFVANGQKLNNTYNYIANIIPNASCVLFRRTAYMNSSFLASIEKLKFTGDWLMWFSILQRSDICYCHQPLNYFRYHAETTRSSAHKRLGRVKEHYAAIDMLSRMVYAQPDANNCENKFAELFADWNPPLVHFFQKENLAVLKLAALTDPRIWHRLFRLFLKRIHVI